MEPIIWETNDVKVLLECGPRLMQGRQVLRELQSGRYMPRALFGDTPIIISHEDGKLVCGSHTFQDIRLTLEGGSDLLTHLSTILCTPVDFRELCYRLLANPLFPVLRAPQLDFEMVNTRAFVEQGAKHGIGLLLKGNNQDVSFAVYCCLVTFNAAMPA